jgi:hypothetical protein
MKNYYFILLFIATVFTAGAQLCTNPRDSVYGLSSVTGSSSGQIVAISLNNAGTTTIGGTPASSNSANGVGFSPLNGRFYFFNQSGFGTTEFISFNPLTNTKVIHTNPPLFPATQRIRSGTVNKSGTAYYTIFPGATTAMSYPINGPAFYYYSIGSNSWTLITQTFRDKNGNIVANIASLGSGDMTFDGNGNLWMLCSSQTAYTLYRIKAPLPTTAVPFLTVDTIIAQSPTPSQAAGSSPNVPFTGIAFNSQGKMFIASGSSGGAPTAFHNKLYSLATATSPLVIIGTLPNAYGDDITSCTYPIGVLPAIWVDFNASLQDNKVKLNWTVNEDDNTTGYNVQISQDASHWHTIAHIDDNSPGNLRKYSYVDDVPAQGNHYYRIVRTDESGKEEISVIRLVTDIGRSKVFLAPNPASDLLYFYNKDNSAKMLAQIYDNKGSLVHTAVIEQLQQYISVSHLPRGAYILKLLSTVSTRIEKGYPFVKL